MTRLQRLVGRLKRFHGAPPAPPTRDPFQLIVWEQVGYLADDERRLSAYRMLEERVGLEPADILNASLTTLRSITRRGGAIAADERARRLGTAADRVVKKWNGNLRAVLDLPLADAKKELTKYPAIGGPGAERILLLPAPIQSLASNRTRCACCSGSVTAPREPPGRKAIARLRPPRMLTSHARYRFDSWRICC
jgi:hypothetical protein